MACIHYATCRWECPRTEEAEASAKQLTIHLGKNRRIIIKGAYQNVDAILLTAGAFDKFAMPYIVHHKSWQAARELHRKAHAHLKRRRKR